MNPPERHRAGTEPTGAGPDDHHGLAGPLAFSLLLALVVSAPVSLAVLRGGAKASVALLAFGITLAAVWILGAIAAWALQVIDGPSPRVPAPGRADPTPPRVPDGPLGTNR